MKTAPSTNGSNGNRDSNGRFAKGNPGGPGNPHARKVARLRSLILESVTEDDLRAIVAVLVKRAREGDLPAIPLRDSQFDMAIVSHVAEHLVDPEAVFAELSRVLKPGGRLLLLTPNRWHYVPLGARLMPHRVHIAFNNWRGIETADIFPTQYRANTAGRLRALSEQAGLDVESLEQSETEPEYLAFHLVPYTPGVAYCPLVNRFRFWPKLRLHLLPAPNNPPDAPA